MKYNLQDLNQSSELIIIELQSTRTLTNSHPNQLEPQPTQTRLKPMLIWSFDRLLPITMELCYYAIAIN